MQKVLLLALWVTLISSATYFRLNTAETTRLNIGDSLISTMGLFKATLLQNQCVLSIENFNGNNGYNKLGNYSSPDFTSNCNYLQIVEGRVATDNNSTYLSVGNSFNISTILTIDDTGVIRLIGTYQLPDFRSQESFEVNITTFKTSHTYIYSASQLSVNFVTRFGPISNKNRWDFECSFGQFDVYQRDNPGLGVSYSFSAFTLNNSWIYDFPGNTFPGAIFPNITYTPRCLEPRLYINFKPPYVLVMDEYWPIASVYEQGRYKIAEVSYASIYQPQAWQQQRRLEFRNEHSVCPPYTFKFKGQCVTTCPSPYYHEMRGVNGDCVLTREEYTPKNDTSRVCSCFTDY